MTREEAIKELRGFIGQLTEGCQEAIKVLIPELTESEDERIMREFNDWLCEEIECRTNDLRDEKDRRTLNMLCYILPKVKDWLEKQKEQKQEDLPAGFYVTLNGEKYYAKEVRSNGTNIKVVAPKPAEWSEEDNIGWDEAFACVTRAEKSAKNEEELQNAVTAEKWLKEIKFKYYVHPVKQEWSEEDEKMLGYLLAVIEDGIPTDTGKMGKIVAWLKSLRPSWKPSEEQMSMLLAVIRDPNNAGSESCSLAFQSLYEDLHKL